MDAIYGNWVRPLQGNSWEVKAEGEEREPCEEECWARRGPRELLDLALRRNLVGGRFYRTVLTISEDFRNYFKNMTEVSSGPFVLSEECPDYHRRSGHQGQDKGEPLSGWGK